MQTTHKIVKQQARNIIERGLLRLVEKSNVTLDSLVPAARSAANDLLQSGQLTIDDKGVLRVTEFGELR